jgi:iron complex transport system substrate-binding protein
MHIASLSPAITEILFAFQLQDLIVCTDQFSNFPEEARDIPHLKDHMDIHPQKLLEFEADLIFTATVIQQKLADKLKAVDLSVVHQDPRTINAVYEMIRNLGVILQVEDKAAQLVLQMQQGFNDVQKKSGLLPRRLKVYIEEWHDPPFASGNWVPEVAHIAGVQQFPVVVGELSPQVTLDQVKAFDPDMIVISWCGAAALADKELLKQRKGWDKLRAVQEDHVRVIDDSLLNRPGPRLVEGARRLYGWAFELLH